LFRDILDAAAYFLSHDRIYGYRLLNQAKKQLPS